MSLVVETIRNNSALKERVTQSLADCDNAQKRRVWHKLFQSMQNDSLVSHYSMISEFELAKREVQIDVVRRKFLKKYKHNGVLGLSQ